MTTNTHRFAPARLRHKVAPVCPCGSHQNKDGKFAPFLDDDSGNTGHCFSCGKTFFAPDDSPKQPIKLEPPKLVRHIDVSFVAASMNNYDSNTFAVWLMILLGKPLAEMVLSNYFVGTSRKVKGATLFWQIDERYKVRQCKVMTYKPDGKRDRDRPPFHIGKEILRDKEAHLLPCLFGQHLLKDYRNAIVNIVESEKTAMLMSALQFDKFLEDKQLWLATGGAQGAKLHQQTCLKGRNVVLWPDEDKTDEWKAKADEIKSTIKPASIQVNDFCRRKGLEKSDLADYIETREGKMIREDVPIQILYPFNNITL